MYQRPIESVKSFKSYHANKLLVCRHTHTFAKTIFSGSKGLKTGTFDKNGGGGCHILHKSKTFSDENIITQININWNCSIKIYWFLRLKFQNLRQIVRASNLKMGQFKIALIFKHCYLRLIIFKLYEFKIFTILTNLLNCLSSVVFHCPSRWRKFIYLDGTNTHEFFVRIETQFERNTTYFKEYSSRNKLEKRKSDLFRLTLKILLKKFPPSSYLRRLTV